MAKQMIQSLPAIFARGGTSNGLIINRAHLPEDQSEWQHALARVMGSPDPYGSQLNGMGGGYSSTSKICVLSPSDREDADVDYTFVQVGIKEGNLDLAGNCGNMSSAVGPIAWNEAFTASRSTPENGQATVRIFNTNTNKVIHNTFLVDEKGMFDPCGGYSIAGVPGTGSKITLSFLDPAGSKTGRALPTGNPIDTLTTDSGELVRASLVDVANPGIFILASDLGIPSDITPTALGADSDMMSRLEQIRQAGARMMGLDSRVQTIPKIVMIARPSPTEIEDGITIICRALSMQQAHKAVPLTLALNLGAACRIPGTLPAEVAVNADKKSSVSIAHASGRIDVGAKFRKDGKIESALLHRTARMLMKGEVFYTIENDEKNCS